MPFISFEAVETPNFTRPELLRHPTIPRPLSGTAPRAIMGKEWWDKTRHEAYAKNNMRCWACGGPGPLEAHEAYEIDYEAGRMTYIETVALCHLCHSFIHMGRTMALTASGAITPDRAASIILHGRTILQAAGLECPWSTRHILQIRWYNPIYLEMAYEIAVRSDPIPEALERVPPWDDWRLIFEGKEYPPKYKSAQDYERSLL